MAVEEWVKELVEEACLAEFPGTRPIRVGDITFNPETGKAVKIVGGAYWTDGGFSNHWSWREVLPDGTLSDTVEHGYGWRVKGD